MDITKDISDAIAKNLPGAVGAELQTLLAQAKKDAAGLAEAQDKNVSLQSRLTTALADIDKLKAEIAAHGALAERETKVSGRERDIDIRELRQELAAEKRISAHGLDITSRLVRNLDYRSAVMSSVNVPVVIPSPSGYSTTQVHQQQQTDNKTSTAE